MRSVRFGGFGERQRDNMVVELIKEIAVGVGLGAHTNIVPVRYALIYDEEVLIFSDLVDGLELGDVIGDWHGPLYEGKSRDAVTARLCSLAAQCARGHERSCANMHPLANRRGEHAIGNQWPTTFTIQVRAKQTTTEEWVHTLLRTDAEVLEAAGRTVAHVPRHARRQAAAQCRLRAIQALANDQAA